VIVGEDQGVRDSIRRLIVAGCLAVLGLLPATLAAQTYPGRPVKIIVPVPPGGAQDVFARAIAQELSLVWKQPVIVDNKPGSGSVVATGVVAHAAPDGLTILQMESVPTLMVLMYLANRPYDFDKDLEPVMVLMGTRGIIVGSPKLAASNLKELAAMARAKPGQINYGSFGVGSIPHIDIEAWAAMAGVRFNHVPYRGGAPLAQALMQDEISFAETAPTPALPLIRDNLIKPLAYPGPHRSPLFPDVPTMTEQGYPFESSDWFGWMVPAGTPPVIVKKIAADAGAVMTRPDFTDKYMTKMGNELINADAATFKTMMAESRKLLEQRTAPLNIKLEF
jgi:tripartite-type tricarboxylate transporter receptor subunit TctC